mmetsp:Transcript_9979/g.25072  ORF Transcript_9979/g.25072 Transcript_9979/m.25072 type:complete len:156 (+) Transcript_9979:165-632(+)
MQEDLQSILERSLSYHEKFHSIFEMLHSQLAELRFVVNQHADEDAFNGYSCTRGELHSMVLEFYNSRLEELHSREIQLHSRFAELHSVVKSISINTAEHPVHDQQLTLKELFSIFIELFAVQLGPNSEFMDLHKDAVMLCECAEMSALPMPEDGS